MAYTMTQKNEYCEQVVAKMKSYEGHNAYSQSNRYNVKSSGAGSGDCSSVVWTAYNEVLGINIGANTTAQYSDSDLVTANVTITDGIPDESQLQLGDLLYFRGTDSSRASSGYVGHVEMYVGNGELSGHGGPGIGPTRKTMSTYCKNRQNTSSPNVTPSNRGLAIIRRAAVLDGADTSTVTTDSTTTEYVVINEGCYPQYTGSTTSLVTALAAVGCTDTSKSYRTTIAELNGIENYSGTASQNTSLLNMLKEGILKDPETYEEETTEENTSTSTTEDKSEYFDACDSSCSTLIIALKSVGCEDTSYEYRELIAAANGIENYSGTASQNIAMLDMLKDGMLKKPTTSNTTADTTKEDDVEYFDKYTGSSVSIVAALKAVGCTDTSISYRKLIAAANNIDPYTGTSSQNTTMLNMLKAGTLKIPQ